MLKERRYIFDNVSSARKLTANATVNPKDFFQFHKSRFIMNYNFKPCGVVCVSRLSVGGSWSRDPKEKNQAMRWKPDLHSEVALPSGRCLEAPQQRDVCLHISHKTAIGLSDFRRE
ncbi:hypothetical protein AVEN_198643-1 [Araneus ventricosus]|uniref:Uncharacterized protein n=1 Tax=Araneus ventricosus TaxID=182803 RepID=A0A4Y2QCY0_ARAVE|nr:hypothetical protein AVEN_129487-1 [Araneus ventricosus]GBN60512.1 hypothetical protein AVEN_198643-1 [Araneus ventricosus]